MRSWQWRSKATAIWDSPQVSSRFLSSECFEKSHSNCPCLHFHNSKIDCYLTREKKLNPFNFTRRNQRPLDTCRSDYEKYVSEKQNRRVCATWVFANFGILFRSQNKDRCRNCSSPKWKTSFLSPLLLGNLACRVFSHGDSTQANWWNKRKCLHKIRV